MTLPICDPDQFDAAELISLDVTIARFILPRLRAFKDATNSYPQDLDDMGEWHAELDEMIAAFERIVEMTEDAYEWSSHEVLALFARRLGHLWQ